jgi:hypothetical protein
MRTITPAKRSLYETLMRSAVFIGDLQTALLVVTELERDIGEEELKTLITGYNAKHSIPNRIQNNL